MINLVAVKALAGFNYVRADQVVAIAASEPTKCVIYLVGGVTIPCSEPVKDVIARLEAATAESAGETQEEPK
ncbi:MAG: hypothetical protein ACLPSW_25575 [Roseiarcus sp.]